MQSPDIGWHRVGLNYVRSVGQLGFPAFHACYERREMTIDPRGEALDRLSATSEALRNLKDVFASEEPLDDVTGRVAATATRAIRHADGVSITVVRGEDAETRGHNDDWVLNLDRPQYESGRGPCLDAAKDQQPIHADVNADDNRWPEFGEAAQQLGVHTVLSLPLTIDASHNDPNELVGSLNVYSYSASAFDPFDESLMHLFSVAAEQAIANARRWQFSRKTLTQLERALDSRGDIEQAKGVLRALHGYSADEAFAELVKQSQRRNIKLRDVAVELLASLDKPLTN
jgi:hypothetical protein